MIKELLKSNANPANDEENHDGDNHPTSPSSCDNGVPQDEEIEISPVSISRVEEPAWADSKNDGAKAQGLKTAATAPEGTGANTNPVLPSTAGLQDTQNDENSQITEENTQGSNNSQGAQIGESTVLTPDEARTIVDRVNRGTLDIGRLLIRLDDGNGYAALNYKSATECYKAVFPTFSVSYLMRIRKATRLCDLLSLDLSKMKESRLRPLFNLSDEDAKRAWKHVVDKQPDINKVTAKLVMTIMEELFPMTVENNPPRKAVKEHRYTQSRLQIIRDRIKNEIPPKGKYKVIVVDPPWPINGLKYHTMTMEKIQEFPHARNIADDNCWLFLWTLDSKLRESYDILEQWGFKYELLMVWRKNGGPKLPEGPTRNAEFILVGKKGNAKFLDTKEFFVCFDADRGEHSEKPQCFYDLVNRVCEGPRIDLFARKERTGFDVWGAEISEEVILRQNEANDPAQNVRAAA
ncbi:MAG: hypothetical protein HQL56_03535 [Magnetococcales bacterium]|nr:hypothetical protein [Magnetococcales bacterium]